MTTTTHTIPKTPPAPPAKFRLPEPPRRHPDETTNYYHLHRTGNSHHLIQHFGNPDSTLVTADHWVISDAGTFHELARYPDLLIAFNVDPEAHHVSNGYINSQQGKPADFVLEVASPSTGSEDVNEKRRDYATLGVLEYWRFDETGEHHGARLAGDRLVDGRYEPIDIDQLPGDVLQGYSAALNLYLRWEAGRLGWYDPDTGRHIPTFESERERADAARERANAAQVYANLAETQADAERSARLQARIRELEAENRRLRNLRH